MLGLERDAAFHDMGIREDFFVVEDGRAGDARQVQRAQQRPGMPWPRDGRERLGEFGAVVQPARVGLEPGVVSQGRMAQHLAQLPVLRIAAADHDD